MESIPYFHAIFARAGKMAVDGNATEASRIQAVLLLGLAHFEEARPALLAVVDRNQPQAIQLAAISTLGRFNRPEMAAELTRRWTSLTPRLRSEALNVLLARPERAAVLLEAIKEGTIRAADLSSPQIKFLCSHKDQGLREQAVKLLSNPSASTRDEIVKAFLPALNLTGEASRGKGIYLERCSSCHRLGGDGYAVGPDLVTVKTGGKEKLLLNILDPNREVQPAYVSYLIETQDDESLIGVIANETGASVTLRQAFARDTVIARAKIRKVQSLGQSLMPEGLETGMGAQAMADLLEYIAATEAPNAR